jgi:hypothetical protein
MLITSSSQTSKQNKVQEKSGKSQEENIISTHETKRKTLISLGQLQMPTINIIKPFKREHTIKTPHSSFHVSNPR